MDDTPYINDGADASLRKTVSLLNKIEAKTGSTTITGPVTVSNEVEVTNSTGNPIPVSGTVGLDSTSLAALENISVTFPATQNVNVTNAGLSVSVSNLPATQPVSGSVSVSNFPATQPVSLASVPSHPVTGPLTNTELRAAAVPVSLASAPVTPVTDNGGSLTVDGTVTVNDMTSGNAKTKIVDSTGADVSYIPAGTAGFPSSSVLSVQGISGGTVIGIDSNHVGDGIQAYLNDHGNDIPVSNQSITNIDADLGATTDSAATTDTGTFSAIALIKRGMQNWTSLLAKIPALVSGRIPVDGSGVTQPISAASLPLPSGASTAAKQPALGTAGTPSSDVITVQGASVGTALNTKETQPSGDYVINTSAFANFSPVGSALTSSAFDAGANADYIVITLEGGGSSGAFSFDLSILNTGLWDPSGTGAFYVYYDTPANSATDAYSYRSVSSTTLFGATRTAFNGRFIIPLTQNTPYAGTSTTYRYIRLTCPASYGGWRYRFTSYKSVNSLLAASVPGNASTTRVNGRVDVGYVSNLPTLTATVTQATATNLKTQAETYQGGTAVGSANPLQVTLANTAANATAVKVDGSAVTQPVSGTVTINKSQGATVTQSTFTSTTASTSLVSASANRKTLTVFNEGAGMLYVSAGSTCTTTAYQVRLSAGDYWECPSNQTSLAHTAVFASTGNARVTEVV